MASSDEDWVGGVAAAAEVAEAADLAELSDEDWVGLPGEPAALPAEPAPKRRTRAQILADARAAKAAKRARLAPIAPASAASSSALLAAPGASADCDEGSVIARTLCRCETNSFQSFLKPAAAHAAECGIQESKYREHLWCYDEALHSCLRAESNALVQHCVGDSEAAAAPVDPHLGPRPMLFVRQRKYDETSSKKHNTFSNH